MKKLALRLVCSVLLCVLFLTVGCNRNPLHRADIDYSLLRQKVIDLLTNGSITEDSTGKLELPEDLKAASVGGVAFVSRERAVGLLIVFLNTAPTAESKERGILYSTGDGEIASQTIVVGGMQWHIDRPVEQHVWTVTRI